jgi:hypothetical protein
MPGGAMIVASLIKRFEFPGSSFGVRGSKFLFQYHYNCLVPSVMKVLLGGSEVHLLARAAPVCVCRSMERLMDVANEMNEKGEVASCGPICHSRHYEDDARTHRFLP